MDFTLHPQWNDVRDVAARIQAAGYLTYLAGGCVRDGLLGVLPKDFDIVTEAPLADLENLFPEALSIGKQFGIVILPHPLGSIEIATFRKDGDYQDGRRPTTVSTATPEEDARRRDFTVNALFLDLKTSEVLDFVGGTKDLQLKLIRTVGDPELRFREDHLRVLRGIRFVSQLGFALEPQTQDAIFALKNLVSKVSQERLRDELLKLLHGAHVLKGLQLLEQSGVYEVLFTSVKDPKPTWQKFQFLTEQDAEEALWFFLCLPWIEIPDVDPETLLAKLRLPKSMLSRLTAQVNLWRKDWSLLRKGHLLKTLGLQTAPWYLKARQLKKAPGEASIFKDCEAIFPLPEPLLTGHEVMKAGLSGKEVGEVLAEAYCLQLEQKWLRREDALSWLKNKWQDG